MKDSLGQGGWLAVLAVLVGGIVRLLKTNRLNLILAKFSLPPVPKRALPWIAVLLGFALAMLEAFVSGAKLPQAVTAGLLGVLSGATAVGGDQTVGKLVETKATRSKKESVAALGDDGSANDKSHDDGSRA